MTSAVPPKGLVKETGPERPQPRTVSKKSLRCDYKCNLIAFVAEIPARRMSSPTPSRKAAAPLPSISDAEWVVMREFWRRDEATAKDIVAALAGAQRWKPRTVQTLINRLVAKRALTFEQRGREYVYRAAVAEERCAHAASRSLIDRVFMGRLAPLLATFLKREKISPSELEELRSLLEEDQR